jgi:hypothetical protein
LEHEKKALFKEWNISKKYILWELLNSAKEILDLHCALEKRYSARPSIAFPKLPFDKVFAEMKQSDNNRKK